MKNLVLIFGAPGVGKTATCEELKNLLPKNILLEGDWLWSPTPFFMAETEREMFYKNLVYVLDNFLSHPELENIIHSWVVPEKEVLQKILLQLSLENVNLHIFALTCSEQEHMKRIENDVNPRRRATHVGGSIKRLEQYNDVNHKKIDTTGLTAKEVAGVISKEVMACC